MGYLNVQSRFHIKYRRQAGHAGLGISLTTRPCCLQHRRPEDYRFDKSSGWWRGRQYLARAASHAPLQSPVMHKEQAVLFSQLDNLLERYLILLDKYQVLRKSLGDRVSMV